MNPDEDPSQTVNPSQPPSMVHVVRSVDPARAPVGAEAQRRHVRSKRLYPLLNLSDGEYVVRVVRRHPIGLVVPLVIGSLLIAAIATVLVSYNDLADGFIVAGREMSPGVIVLPGLVFMLFIAAAMAVSSYVYLKNRLFLPTRVSSRRFSLVSFLGESRLLALRTSKTQVTHKKGCSSTCLTMVVSDSAPKGTRRPIGLIMFLIPRTK